MGRWLAATALLAAALAAGVVAFLNGGDPLPIRVTPTRSIALPLGTALGLAFATGALVVALVAAAGAVARVVRRRLRVRTAARTTARLARERVRAETLLVGGAPDAARTQLADALGAHGPDERLLELLAGASERSGDLAGAIAATESARARLPGSPLLARRLASLYAAAGRWEDALATEDALVRALPPAAAATETATLCGLRFEAARADADRGRGLRRLFALAREHPGFVPAWVEAGDRLRADGRTFRARRTYERGARVRPVRVLVDRLFTLLVEGGRPDRARTAVRRLQQAHSGSAALTVYLARTYLRDDALDDAERLLASWPADAPTPAIEALRGELARRQGRIEQAVGHFAHAADGLDAGGQRCRACGASAAAWGPRCERCGAWDTIAADAEWSEPVRSEALI
jgi:tetratricopeptide (TPR) repeat protein